MKTYAILATLAFAGYLGISTMSTSAEAFEQPGTSDGAVLRIALDQIPDRTGSVETKKHLRAEKLLAGMVFGECRGQGEDCMVAVGHVAMNRAKQNLDVRYGKGLTGVLRKHKAFSCFLKNDPNKKVIDKAMSGRLAADSADGQAWAVAQQVAHTLMHRQTVDPTHGATHYFAKAIVKPAWIRDNGMHRITQIDGHVFYRKDA